MYSPESSLTTERVKPVALCVNVTFAPATAAPLGSVTAPRNVPLTACAKAVEAPATSSKQSAKVQRHRSKSLDRLGKDIGISLKILAQAYASQFEPASLRLTVLDVEATA